ncbi:MAG: rod shape-determining protein MreC [Flavobacteriaceae bacterium]
MQQIVNFIIRYRDFLFYIFLLSISLALTIGSHSYHQSKYFNSANWISGSVYNASNTIDTYFDLDGKNQKLLEENLRLRQVLYNLRESDSVQIDSVQLQYTISTAHIIKNSYASNRNYLTIDKGVKDGIQVDMGVISHRGIIGIVESTSNRYATVQSILNERSNINAKLLHTNHFGSLVWNGQSYDEVQLVDIPKLAPLTIGDTIVTGGMSSIFPENVPIGVVKTYDFDTSQSFYTIVVDLFNDMTDLNAVYIVQNKDREEIIELEAKTEENAQ